MRYVISNLYKTCPLTGQKSVGSVILDREHGQMRKLEGTIINGAHEVELRGEGKLTITIEDWAATTFHIDPL